MDADNSPEDDGSSLAPETKEPCPTKLPPSLRNELKARAASLAPPRTLEEVFSEALGAWAEEPEEPNTPPVKLTGSVPFTTMLPAGQWALHKKVCSARGVTFAQGAARAVRRWLEDHPEAWKVRHPGKIRRIIVCNQKGGVGKTTLSWGMGQAAAEGAAYLDEVLTLLKRNSLKNKELIERIEQAEASELRVLLVDYDPQAHLTKQLGLEVLPAKGPSLAKAMLGHLEGSLADLVVPLADARFGGRLHVLPACRDAFLLDAGLAGHRSRSHALETALKPLENDYDVMIIDAPPSLGLSMDAALHYGRRRDGESKGQSGCLIVVQAEDSSADAYDLLLEQIQDLMKDSGVPIELLGLVVNLYDASRGYIATSSLEGWQTMEEIRCVGVIPDLKEVREAVRLRIPLFTHDPVSLQAIELRTTWKEIS
ncbi:ParA family protein [Streptomyces sp. ZAF1911]|uniref:ParA family protein n=1 Tax=Streptomyces sp. ZAF1911 TaxID=2944129 RepID=UPI00237B267D|nr:ParA family protein [Streptomyces sp. ZAF1911]MDD9383124.1 ParA family protein [Streptomyces sp. ZAF1911]